MDVVGSAHYSFYLGRLGNYSALSATDTACERSALTLGYERMKFEKNPNTDVLPHVSAKNAPMYRGRVYWRRKHYDPVILFPSGVLEDTLPKAALSGVCPSIGSEDISLASEKHKDDRALHETEGVRSSMSVVISSDEPNLVQSGAIDECLDEQHDSDVKGNGAKSVDIYSVDDNCSSSMINMEAGSASLKTEVDENGECSSSGAFIGELMGQEKSEKDLCISILKNHQLLSCFLPNNSCTSEDDIASCSGFASYCSCNVCGLLGKAENMLICDQCEGAVHVSCCNSTQRKISFDEWFCQCCLIKKHKIMEETTWQRSTVIQSELNSRPVASKAKTSSVAAMLKDSEPYTTGVRIGKDFQAVVPCWSGPITEDIDVSRAPMELDLSDISTFHELNSLQLCKRKPIGNWLQCQDVIVGAGESDGTICGKWRRAPLFEVKTDNWDCFSSVLWDPTQADCAVPQELETGEVLRQLKYIEMLIPRLEAKKRKLDVMEVNNSGRLVVIEDVG